MSLTKEQAFDAMVARYNMFVPESDQKDGATWDNKDENFKEDLANLMKQAGGDPQGKPRRRPGS